MTTIWATSTTRRAGSNRSRIRSRRNCHPCLWNEVLPMCPEWTYVLRHGAYSLAPLIHSRIVAYSGESLVNRMPPPCDRVADPATPSDSELDVGLRSIKLFSGFAWSTTFNAVENVALNNVCVAWQCTQA